MVQAVVGMLFIAHHLIDRFSDVNAPPFQFHLDQRKPVDKDSHIIAIDIFSDNCGLVCNLENVFGVIAIEK